MQRKAYYLSELALDCAVDVEVELASQMDLVALLAVKATSQ